MTLHEHTIKKLGRKPNPPVDEKKCSYCGKIKPAREFDKRGGDIRTLQSECKECRREYQRMYRAKIRENPKKYRDIKIQRAEYYQRYRDTRKQLGNPIYKPKEQRIGNVLKIFP